MEIYKEKGGKKKQNYSNEKMKMKRKKIRKQDIKTKDETINEKKKE